MIEYISDRGYVQWNLGDLERSLSQPDAALDWYAKAIATLEKSPSRDATGTNSHSWLCDAAAKKAALLTELKRYPAALQEWDYAETVEKGVRAQSREARAVVLARTGATERAVAEAAYLAELDKVPAGALCNLARVYALSAGQAAAKKDDYVEQAVRLLRRAYDAGFFADGKGVSQLKSDDDFTVLRKEPAFTALLKEIEKP